MCTCECVLFFKIIFLLRQIMYIFIFLSDRVCECGLVGHILNVLVCLFVLVVFRIHRRSYDTWDDFIRINLGTVLHTGQHSTGRFGWLRFKRLHIRSQMDQHK